MANSLATGTAPNLLGRVTEGIVDVSHSFVGAADVCVRPHVFFCWYSSLAELGKGKNVINTCFGDTVEGRNPKQPPWMLKNP